MRISSVVRIWTVVLSIIFLAVLVLGILAIALIKVFVSVGIGILVFGVVGLVISVFGFVGADFNKNSGSKLKEFVLIIFFTIMLILHILFVIFGVAFVCILPSVKMIVTLPVEKFNKIYNSLPKSFREDNHQQAIEKIQSFALGLGVVIIVIAVIILITCIASGCLMGKLSFSQSFIVSFSIIKIIVGIAIGILLIVSYTQNNVILGSEIPVGKSVTVVIIIFGFLLAAVGFAGLFIPCLGTRFKVVSAIFNVGNITLLIAFVVLFILSVVFRGLIEDWGKKDLCQDPADGVGENPCAQMVLRGETNLCQVENTTSKVGDECVFDIPVFRSDVINMVQNFATILWFMCLYMAIFLGVVTILTCINCLADDGKPKKDPPVYILTEPILDYNYY